MKFTGEYLDPTGLYDLRAREYATTEGRFLALDSLERAPDQPKDSSYVYSDAMPTMQSDPSGQGPIDIGAPSAADAYRAASPACVPGQAIQYTGSARTVHVWPGLFGDIVADIRFGGKYVSGGSCIVLNFNVARNGLTTQIRPKVEGSWSLNDSSLIWGTMGPAMDGVVRPFRRGPIDLRTPIRSGTQFYVGSRKSVDLGSTVFDTETQLLFAPPRFVMKSDLNRFLPYGLGSIDYGAEIVTRWQPNYKGVVKNAGKTAGAGGGAYAFTTYVYRAWERGIGFTPWNPGWTPRILVPAGRDPSLVG